MLGVAVRLTAGGMRESQSYGPEAVQSRSFGPGARAESDKAALAGRRAAPFGAVTLLPPPSAE